VPGQAEQRDVRGDLGVGRVVVQHRPRQRGVRDEVGSVPFEEVPRRCPVGHRQPLLQHRARVQVDGVSSGVDPIRGHLDRGGQVVAVPHG
jgi:hypothetical protein